MSEDYPCDLKEWRKFGELDPRDEVERLKIETFGDLFPIAVNKSKAGQFVKINEEKLGTVPIESISRSSVSRDEVGIIKEIPQPT